MVSRIYTAAFIVVFSLGSMLVPNETFGRDSGRSSSGFHPSIVYINPYNPSFIDITRYSPPPNPVVVYYPGCDTQTVTVLGEDGKEHSVNIVRC
jgi:hypothetical protein